MKAYKHQKQDKKNNCGQTCVSIITGIHIKEVEKRMNRSGLTRTHHMVFGLEDFNIKVLNKQLKRMSGWEAGLPQQAIFKMTWMDGTKRMGHWIVYKDNIIYDPAQDGPMSFIAYYNLVGKKIWPTSYMEYHHEKTVNKLQ